MSYCLKNDASRVLAREAAKSHSMNPSHFDVSSRAGRHDAGPSRPPSLAPRRKCSQPCRSSSVPSTRLFQIAAERFSREPSGQGRLERGWLDATGGFTVHSIHPTVLAPTMPENALGKRLIFTEAWHALGELGPTARANFRLKPPETAIVIAGLLYFEVEPHPEARPDAGLLVNVSNRGYVEPGRPLTAGFVVTEQARRVLIRGIGPALGSVPGGAAAA
jgi:hypothetical protein